MLTAVLLSFFSSFLLCFILIKYEHIHESYSHDKTHGEPQKIHNHKVSRIGGLSIFLGICIAAMYLTINNKNYIDPKTLTLTLLCSLPAFGFGLAEDILKIISPKKRLIATMLSGTLGYLLLNATINRTNILPLDFLLQIWPCSILFTAFAVSGVSNAVNIIDGLNGLASMIAMLCLLACAYIGYKLNDFLIFNLCLIFISAILGFFCWNFPKGKIFLGDGGAYFIGFILAEISILLVARHNIVSPFFPILLLMYPIYETIFSIYRRKFIKKNSATTADAMHLHTLLYKRSKKGCKLSRNSNLSTSLWFLALTSIIPAIFVFKSTFLSLIFIAIFAAIYLRVYFNVIKFK